MITDRRFTVLPLFLLLLVLASAFSLKRPAGDASFRSQNITLLVKGTSTLHDWEMKSNKGFCEAVFALNANEQVTGLTGLSFQVPAESLKSGHTTMDNNTYKALNTKQHKNISFVLTSGSVSPVAATTYQIKAVGKLTIAGNTRETELTAVAKYNPADKSLTVSGTKNLKMTDYGVKPPSVMMGTIKTGNDISIAFQARFVK